MRAYPLAMESVVIPDGVKRIGAYAFTGSVFDHITIPNSVVSIANTAFSGCDHLKVLPNISNDAAAAKAVYELQNEDERLPLGSFICAIDDEGYMTVFREKVVELSDFQADHQPVKTETVYTIGLLDKDFVVNRQGKFVIPPTYTLLHDLGDGTFSAVKGSERADIITLCAKAVKKCRFWHFCRRLHTPLAILDPLFSGYFTAEIYAADHPGRVLCARRYSI